MKALSVLLAAAIILVTANCPQAESEFSKTFKDAYNDLTTDLATKPPAELAEISDFVYKKDVATFTFKSGKMYLLREIDGRPTTGIFLGEGHASINVPSHTERQSLLYASGDSLVDESFEVAFVRFSDDFDLHLKERFSFESTSLPWRDFNQAQQGEFFFDPVVMHTYDNCFQLLRSHYERAEDGYFFIDFNRYVYSFDPNRPEEVIVGYEHEGGDIVVKDGSTMQRAEKAVYDDLSMSDIGYPTTVTSREGHIELGGLDGKEVKEASVELTIRIHEDSLRFMSIFLHHKLRLDSILYKDKPVDFMRRRDFAFTGLILPEYRYSGDVIELVFWYHGRGYHPAFPFVENPSSSTYAIRFDVPSGYGYVIPGSSPEESSDSKMDRYLSSPQERYRMFQFQPYVSSYDTITEISSIGMPVNFLKADHINKQRHDCFVPDEQYRSATMEAFNFMTTRLGPPLGAFSMWVYPEASHSAPGLIGISQVLCLVDGTGGIHASAANAASRQWFGSLMNPRSDREYWLAEALPDYLSLMFVSANVSPSVFFGELKRRRNTAFTTVENDEDWPLAAGRRVPTTDRTVKGAWLLHMLRFMMYDLEEMSDKTFLKFLGDLKILCNFSTFSNKDFIELAEKHYGASLDWFFQQWLYGRNYPEYDIKFMHEERSDGHYVTANALVNKVNEEYRMPVILRVETPDGSSSYHRQFIEGTEDSFELGPFSSKPKDILFNEFIGVLCKDKVKVE